MSVKKKIKVKGGDMSFYMMYIDYKYMNDQEVERKLATNPPPHLILAISDMGKYMVSYT